jgi:hypothetical protein
MQLNITVVYHITEISDSTKVKKRMRNVVLKMGGKMSWENG